MAVLERLPSLDEHRYRQEMQPQRERGGTGEEEEEDTHELSTYSVLSHMQKTGRCGDPLEVRVTKPQTVALDPPVTPPSPPPSSYVQNRSEFVADSYDVGDLHLNIPLMENNTSERIQSSRTYFKDALISNKDSMEKSSYMANTASTHGRKQRPRHDHQESTIKKFNARAPDDEIATTAAIEDSNIPTPDPPTAEPSETAPAESTPTSSEKRGPVRYPSFRTVGECDTPATVEDSKPQGPSSSALLYEDHDDLPPVPVPDSPGAYSIPGILGPSPYRNSATNVRRVDVDSQLVSATLVDDSEIETMNFLRELRADLDRVVQHLQKEEPQQGEVTKKRPPKKWFSTFRGLFQPRRCKSTGAP